MDRHIKTKTKTAANSNCTSGYSPITRVDVLKTDHQSCSAYKRSPVPLDDDVRVPGSPVHITHAEQHLPLVQSGGFLENGET